MTPSYPAHRDRRTTAPQTALAYLLLAFVISWGMVVTAVGLDGFPGTEQQFRSLLPVVVVAMLAGPSVAGMLSMAVFLGKPGFQEMWGRLGTLRLNARWYAAALLTAPLMVSGVLTLLSFRSTIFRLGIATVSAPAPHLAVGILTGLAAGIFEELGWTGFLIPQLRMRCGSLATGSFVGVVWGAWHLLVVWWGSSATSGGLPMTFYLPAMTLSFLPPHRILMVWVYDRTNSLSLAMLMHASLTASVRIFDPTPISGGPIVLYNLALGAAFWGVVAVARSCDRTRGRVSF